MDIEESNLRFTFAEQVTVLKFDDTKFYRDIYNKLPGSKGVDIIADTGGMLQLIEIKNCTGHESENRWRTSANNSKLSAAPSALSVEERDSLDIEIAKKVAFTVACLYGAWTKDQQSEKARELVPFWNFASCRDIPEFRKTIMVILFLEGDFDSGTRSKRMIMKRLEDSAANKLSWLNCKVSVVDSATYNAKCFSVS